MAQAGNPVETNRCCPPSERNGRMTANVNRFDFGLSPAEIDAIAALDSGKSVFPNDRDPASVKGGVNDRVTKNPDKEY